MQIVIDIDEKIYSEIKKGKVYSSIYDVPQEAVLAIANGTLLPKERNGRWEYADSKFANLCIVTCSACNFFSEKRTKFCPYCGARMEVENGFFTDL